MAEDIRRITGVEATVSFDGRVFIVDVKSIDDCVTIKNFMSLHPMAFLRTIECVNNRFMMIFDVKMVEEQK